MESLFKDKVVLITGGTGSIGSELVRQILALNPRQVRVLSRDESRQYELLEALKYPKNLRLLIGDIRDKDRVEFAFKGVDYVFHAAALKQVPFCEYNPFEAVATNIIGSQNVINAAIKNEVKKVIAISTDKAVSPSNVMGTSKLMMEKLFINANFYSGKAVTKFACVRFGNVAWARGSVLPLWKKQAKNDGSINITNRNMTRFLMSTAEAVSLVLQAAKLSQMGEIFIFKMPSIKLPDLARLFIAKYFPEQKIKINIIGSRAGEKLHEELLDDYDRSGQILENKEMFIILPHTDIYTLSLPERSYAGFKKIRTPKSYSSQNRLNIGAIKKII